MRRAPLKRSPAGASRSSTVHRWVPPAAAAVLACTVYFNALHNPFVYDDHDTITANASLADISNVRFLLAYSPFRPVVNISYALDRAVWGNSPVGFHATNIALHAAAVILLFALAAGVLADAGHERW